MIRGYRDQDYEKLRGLYDQPALYGGVFDESRDGRHRLREKISDDPEAILVYDNEDGEMLGTISIIEDGRVAMLYRFAVLNHNAKVARELYAKACAILQSRGHQQVLVYSAANDPDLDKRYADLGMTKGNNYSCFWRDLE
jgi:hypothetical protein